MDAKAPSVAFVKQKSKILKRPRNKPLKIDLGCGIKKLDGFVGLDTIAFKGVDHVCDLTQPWPLADASVDEAHSAHFIEHLDSVERIFFCNELHRVLVPGGKCQLMVPHWSSNRAYGDPTHKWPPVSEFWFYYLDHEWRMREAPHTDFENWPDGFKCDFDVTWGYGLAPTIVQRSTDFHQFAVNYYKDAIYDIIATLTKK